MPVMPERTATIEPATKPAPPARSEINAAQVTVAVLAQTFNKPVPEILAALRRLAAADE